MRRRGMLASTVCALFAGSSAHAEPMRLEASGFIGIASFGADTELGNSWAPEQVPNTAPVLGARVGWIPRLSRHVSLGVEGELSFASAFTGGAALGGGRMSYFAPVFGWRVHALARFGDWARIAPHLIAGAGGETIASSSPFMAKETDPVVYYGAGAAMPISRAWAVRLDARHGLMPSRADGPSSTFEIQLGLATRFGAAARSHRLATPAPLPEPTRADESDRDGDGLPDHLDQCPDEKETVNGIADADGCPEPDPDMDGIIGEADRCPDQAEDFDMFEDTDGCPDLDNDGDAVEDARDVCPNQPETRNGFEDGDGCPDEVPAEIVKVLAAGSKIRFAGTSARVTADAEGMLAKPFALLRDRAELRLVVVGHPPPKTPASDAAAADLAKRRAEAVKWHLVDQGIAQDRIVTVVGPAAASPVELALGLADTGIAQPRPVK